MSKKEQTMITYYVQRMDGNDQKVTVPASWKVTFGPIHPGKNGHDSGKPALRFYESNTKQRMVITNVMSFRDCSIKVEEKRVNVKQQTVSVREGDGMKDVIMEGRIEEWVDPDKPQQRNTEFFKAITQDD